jgi:predicted anti-sigma-YlaC factor YlaD
MCEDDHVNCKALLGSLCDYIDGTLSAELCSEIDRHLSECSDCRVVIDTLNKTVSLYHGSAAETQVPGAVRERLFRVLKLDDYLNR